jgi:hypothetical protein
LPSLLIFSCRSGEVKLTVDAEKMNSQFVESGQYRSGSGTVTSLTPRHKEATLALRQSTTRLTRQHKPDLKTLFDVALIGPNEIIGKLVRRFWLTLYLHSLHKIYEVIRNYNIQSLDAAALGAVVAATDSLKSLLPVILVRVRPSLTTASFNSTPVYQSCC